MVKNKVNVQRKERLNGDANCKRIPFSFPHDSLCGFSDSFVSLLCHTKCC